MNIFYYDEIKLLLEALVCITVIQVDRCGETMASAMYKLVASIG